MTTKITKAVIPCGGMGTRFMPITKAVPKEILPIVDTPVLAYIVNEAIDSGITDIMLILGQGKDAIREYFSPNPRLEDPLAGKPEILALLKSTYSRANIVFGSQPIPKGTADAIYRTRSFTGDEAFCLAYGDDVIYNDGRPVMGQLIDCYADFNKTVLGVHYVEGDEIAMYGTAKIGKSYGRAHECLGMVEKAPVDRIPSRYASLGRFVLSHEVYGEIENTPPGKNNEYQLTDTLNAMCLKQGVMIYDFEGRRYDMGDKFGAVTAIIEYALRSGEYGGRLKDYLNELVKKF